MSDITRIPSQTESREPTAAEQLLPLVYDELRRLAAAKLAREKPGQTLEPTALVHEAYLRLAGGPESGIADRKAMKWNSRGHFFAAAAEAMRRILVESARRKARAKHGGELQRLGIEPDDLLAAQVSGDLLALDDALERLAAGDSQAAELVKLRYFAGLTIPQAADILGVSPRKANLLWFFARAWLRREIEGSH